MVLAQVAGKLAAKPDHVPDELVVDFDLFALPLEGVDIQAKYAEIQRNCPEVFWTPHNSGHWVVTRGEDVIAIERNWKTFSSRSINLPPMPADATRMVPIELDPPEHSYYRRPLMEWLTPPRLAGLETRVRKVAINAIENMVPRGECEFMEQFAKIMPIHVFMDMVDVPLIHSKELMLQHDIVVRDPTPEMRAEARHTAMAFLKKWVVERRETPGEDLLSAVVNCQVAGAKSGLEEAVSFATLVLFGGLDTVTSSLGFFAHFLALNPDHRHEIIKHLDDPKFMAEAVEELFRRYSVVSTARLITSDTDLRGVRMRSGDRILASTIFVGIDERLNTNPMHVDFQRGKPVHSMFRHGVHACPGAALARRELRIFLEEWLRRIPEFELTPGRPLELEQGNVCALTSLHLSWPVPS